jgi:DNA-binding transcriptional MerR regulator
VDNNQAPYLTTSEVSRRLGVSAARVSALESTGQISSIRTESGWRLYARDDVLRLVEGRRRRGVERQLHTMGSRSAAEEEPE